MTTELEICDQASALQTRSAATVLMEKYHPVLQYNLSYDPMLCEWHKVPAYPVGASSQLIPRGDVANLIAALEATLQPANARQVAGATALIATAWPFAWQRLDDETADCFVKQLSEEMSRFPADVLHGVIRNLRRTAKFAPSISEIVEAAEAEVADIRNRIKLAREHERAHQSCALPAWTEDKPKNELSADVAKAAHRASK